MRLNMVESINRYGLFFFFFELSEPRVIREFSPFVGVLGHRILGADGN